MRARSISAILLAAVLAGGCGGGDDGDGEPARIETKADYITAGDKICRDRDDRSLKLAEASNKGNVADLTSALADIYAETIRKQQALELPPGSARAGAQRYVATVTQMTRPVQRMKAAAADLAKAGEDQAAVKKAAATLQANVNTVQSIGDLADQQARSYGFKVCGQQQSPNPVA